MDSRGQSLNIAQKKRDIIKPQAFVFNTFDHIKRIYTAKSHNCHKKTYQLGNKGVHRIIPDDIQ